MTETLEPQQLANLAQQGDLEAFNHLVDQYQDQLFRVAARMLGDGEAAADATQTTWLAAFRKINEYRGGKLSSWLMRILINACYDQLRQRHRRAESPLYPVTYDGDELDTGSWLRDPSPDVEARVESRHMEQAIERALQYLPEVYRSMIILVDIEGFGYEEAAAALRVPLGTVRSRVARGRLALRHQLEESGDAPAAWQPLPSTTSERLPAGRP